MKSEGVSLFVVWLGVGIGRRGDEMHEKEKNGIEPYVQIPPGGFEPPSPDPKSCMIDRYTTGVSYF